MEVPDALKGLTFEKAEFISALLQDESKGIIVGGIAFLDRLLGEVLSAFSHNSNGTAGFGVGKVKKMTFNDKITVFQGLNLAPQPAATRDAIAALLTPMRKIRNVAAHEAAISSADAEVLYSDVDNRNLLSQFPKNFNEKTAEAQRLLQSLQQLPEFGPPS